MKILITGNLGYIGPHVVKNVREHFPSAEVIGADTGFFSSHENSQLPKDMQADITHKIDLRDATPELFEGVNAIIHLAAISNDPMGKEFEQSTYEINHKMAINLAKMAKKAGVETFAFASSCSVYGFSGSDIVTEDSKTNPVTAYAISKKLAEEDLEALTDTGFSVTCLRFATACGYSPVHRLDLVLNDFAYKAATNGKIDILSDGTPWRPLIHVNDMSRAFCWAIRRQVSEGGNFLIINVGHEEWNFRVSDLASAVCNTLPQTEVTIQGLPGGDSRSYRVGFDKFRQLAPSAQPLADLQSTIEALTSTAELLRSSLSEPDINTTLPPSFIRLDVLRDHISNHPFGREPPLVVIESIDV